jgi:hypothetical protein
MANLTNLATQGLSNSTADLQGGQATAAFVQFLSLLGVATSALTGVLGIALMTVQSAIALKQLLAMRDLARGRFMIMGRWVKVLLLTPSQRIMCTFEPEVYRGWRKGYLFVMRRCWRKHCVCWIGHWGFLSANKSSVA